MKDAKVAAMSVGCRGEVSAITVSAHHRRIAAEDIWVLNDYCR
jgi:hypothetical protein